MAELFHAARASLARSLAALAVTSMPAMGVVGAATLACACNDAPGADKKGAVRDVLAESIRHQAAMLAILELRRDEPVRAVAEIEAYVRDNGASLDRIAHQRALLESDMTAMAVAMQTYGPALGQNLDRRARLETERPELMADPRVRAALARLDAL